MAFTVDELHKGARAWKQAAGAKPLAWQRDFHSENYEEWADLRRKHFLDHRWLENSIEILKEWKAVRGEESKKIETRIRRNLKQFRAIWRRDIARVAEIEDVIPLKEGVDIEAIAPARIKSFVELAEEMKKVAEPAPVFVSKFCHLAISPQVFPVIDRAFLGMPFSYYMDYYRVGREEWCETALEVQNELIRLMKRKVGPRINKHFPLKTKIIELCYAGRYARWKEKKRA